MMDIFPITYNNEDYYEDSKDSTKKKGNRICKNALIKGLNNILTNGHVVIREKAVIRGDLAKIHFGQYVIVSEEVVLHPYKLKK